MENNYLILSGNDAESYINITSKLISASKLNKYFPDQNEILAIFNYLKPATNFNLYPDFQIAFNSGMPSEKSITRLKADKDISEKFLKEGTQSDFEKAYNDNPSPLQEKRLRQYKYYNNLFSSTISPTFNLDLKLKWIDEVNNKAFFIAILDRFDLGENLFVRYTVHLSQVNERWSKPQVVLEGDDLKATEAFRNIIARYSSDESEFAYLLLSDLKNIQVEEVARAKLGPLFFKGSFIPKDIMHIFQKDEKAFILNLPFDKTSLNIAKNTIADPFGRFYRDYLDDKNKAEITRKAEIFGYHVYKERRFAVSMNIYKEFSDFIKAKGYNCIIYPVKI